MKVRLALQLLYCPRLAARVICVDATVSSRTTWSRRCLEHMAYVA